MTSESNKMLEFHQYQKSDKASSIIYADLESMIEKSIAYKNNSEKSSTRKVSEYIRPDFQCQQYRHLKT